MAEKLQPVRGTHDLLPDEARKHRHITEQALDIAKRYGYGEIATPIFEFSEVFHRTLGDTSDVVTKETYSFDDRGGEKLTLRPEFTASIARAFISNGLQDQLPLKFFYAGPAFRYERPQKGRQRQFHQIGTELLGVAEPQGDIETIALAYQVLIALGLKDKVKLEINTLGTKESREGLRNEIVGALSKYRQDLSKESQIRLDKNPLRILDSKDPNDRQIITTSGTSNIVSTYFSIPVVSSYFDQVRTGLDALNISYKINHELVRGLDYYNHTVFEFTTDLLGAQGTVLAGGRYDGLIELMGGPATPGIGWAAGVERLASLMDWQAQHVKTVRPIAIIPLGERAEKEALKSAEWMRKEGYHVELAYKGNLGNRMKKANRVNACAAIIFGDAELDKGVVAVKDLDKGEQKEVPLSGLMSELAPYKDKH